MRYEQVNHHTSWQFDDAQFCRHGQNGSEFSGISLQNTTAASSHALPYVDLCSGARALSEEVSLLPVLLAEKVFDASRLTQKTTVLPERRHTPMYVNPMYHTYISGQSGPQSGEASAAVQLNVETSHSVNAITQRQAIDYRASRR